MGLVTKALKRRKWAIVVALAILLAGMGWTFGWPAIYGHFGNFATAGDLWGSYRDSQYIWFGDFGGIYHRNLGFIASPGILVALLPMAILGSHFHIAADFPYYMPRPWMWLALEPYVSLLMILPLAGIDNAAERLGMSKARRILTVFLTGAALFEAVIVWGHPEDPIALGLAIYGLLAAWDKRPVATGWFFGAALAFQPLAILVAPLALALLLPRQWWSVIWRGALVPAVMLAVPFIWDFHATARAILQQPTYPKVDHPTPWLALAPVLAKGVVSGSRTRIGAAIVDLLIGAWAWRHRPERLVSVIWLAGVMLSAWCLFEAVMVPYYVTPGVTLLLIAALINFSERRYGPAWLATALIAAGGVEAWTYERPGAWEYWGVMVVMLAILAMVSMPRWIPALAPRMDEGMVGGAFPEEPRPGEGLEHLGNQPGEGSLGEELSWVGSKEGSGLLQGGASPQPEAPRGLVWSEGFRTPEQFGNDPGARSAWRDQRTPRKHPL
jgi:hypothetical protein